MANRVETFQVTIPAATAMGAPVTTPLTFDEGDVQTIEVVIPDGVAGLAGFYFAKGGQQVVPYRAGQFIVSNDEKIRWDLTELPEGTGWQLVGYNTDVYNHTFYIRLHVSDYHVIGPVSDPTLALSLPAVGVTDNSTAGDVATVDTTGDVQAMTA